MNIQNMAYHRDSIDTEWGYLQNDTSQTECKKVESCISNTKNIIVKLDDLRKAKDHAVSEFCKGIFNIIGGVFALITLTAIQLVCAPTIFIPGICKYKTGSLFLPGFSKMANVVARGGARVANACSKAKVLASKIEGTVDALNSELTTLPIKLKTVNDTQQAVQRIKDHIAAIADLQPVEGVLENRPIQEENDFHKTPSYTTLQSMVSTNFVFVKLVRELSRIVDYHRIDLDEDLKRSLLQYNTSTDDSFYSKMIFENGIVPENVVND